MVLEKEKALDLRRPCVVGRMLIRGISAWHGGHTAASPVMPGWHAKTKKSAFPSFRAVGYKDKAMN
jgi:hypothetical protein